MSADRERALAFAFTLACAGSLCGAGAPPFYPDRKDLLQVVDPSGGLRRVQNPADWVLRRNHIIANMELVMGPVPERFRALPLEPRTIERVELPRYTRAKVAFRAEPADEVTAYLLVPKGATGRLPAVLCLHQTIAIGKGGPVGMDGNPDLHYAAELCERGYVTLAPDAWNFGDYREKKYDPFAHGYVSGTMKSIWNHVRSLDFLCSLPEVDPERIGCIGHSLGGHNTLWLAAFDRRVKVMVSSCGFSSMPSYAASKYGGGDLKNYAQRVYMPRIASEYGNDPRRLPFDWTETLAALAPRPVFVCAPLRDENFLVDGVRECFDAALPVYRLLGAAGNLVVVNPDTGHTFPPEARAAAYAFIDKALGKSAAPPK